MRRQRSPGQSRIVRLLNEPRRLIVTILLGNEFTNLLLSTILAGLVIHFFGESKSYYNILIATPLLLVFGEITPKAIAVRNNRAFARFQAPILHAFAQFISPIRSIVRLISDKLIVLLIGNHHNRAHLISEDMLITLTREALGDGVLDAHEVHYINQVFKFGDAVVDDAMTPRSNMLFISHKAKGEEVVDTIRTHLRDKLVIYKEKHDQVVGLLFARDLLGLDLKRKLSENWLTNLARKPMLVPQTKPLLDLFYAMRAQKVSIALVIDEYGGIVGQVTLNDVLDFVFGETPIEAPAAAGPLKKVRLPGTMEVTKFNHKYHTKLDTTHGDTLNGLLLHKFGELPAPRVCTSIDGVNFTVLKVADNRITQVLAQAKVTISSTQASKDKLRKVTLASNAKASTLTTSGSKTVRTSTKTHAKTASPAAGKKKAHPASAKPKSTSSSVSAKPASAKTSPKQRSAKKGKAASL